MFVSLYSYARLFVYQCIRIPGCLCISIFICQVVCVSVYSYATLCIKIFYVRLFVSILVCNVICVSIFIYHVVSGYSYASFCRIFICYVVKCFCMLRCLSVYSYGSLLYAGKFVYHVVLIYSYAAVCMSVYSYATWYVSIFVCHVVCLYSYARLFVSIFICQVVFVSLNSYATLFAYHYIRMQGCLCVSIFVCHVVCVSGSYTHVARVLVLFYLFFFLQ